MGSIQNHLTQRMTHHLQDIQYFQSIYYSLNKIIINWRGNYWQKNQHTHYKFNTHNHSYSSLIGLPNYYKVTKYKY